LISLACLPRYTSGQTYFYPAFNAARPEDAIKLARELGDLLAMPVMLEAVMRVRASRGEVLGCCVKLPSNKRTLPGLRSTSYHGNFFTMKTDLLAMPAVPQNQGYVVELEIEETLTQPYIVFQTAVMHTTSEGMFSLLMNPHVPSIFCFQANAAFESSQTPSQPPRT
jgi:protein transport protein SEC24